MHRRSRLTQPHAGEGGRRAEAESVAGPRKPARPLAQELDSLGAQTASEKLRRRGAGSPGLGDVPGRRQARRGLEAEVLAGPLLRSSENLSSDRSLGQTGKVPGGARGAKWPKEAEPLEPAARRRLELAFAARRVDGARGRERGVGSCGAEPRCPESRGAAPRPLAVAARRAEGRGRGNRRVLASRPRSLSGSKFRQVSEVCRLPASTPPSGKSSRARQGRG